MSKLYTFGDSFTASDGCRPGESYYENYKKNNELTWPELIANHYNIELVNKGVSGCSNESIIDNIISEWNLLQAEDIVIISKTFSHRFDVPSHPNKNKLISVWGPSWFENSIFSNWPNVDILKSYLLLFRIDNNLYDDRYYNHLNFFKTILKTSKNINCVLWEVDKITTNFEKITQATNGKIVDGHFSYRGHKDFSEWIISKIESTKTTKNDWI